MKSKEIGTNSNVDATEGAKPPLRIGFLLGSLDVEAWRYKVIREVAEAHFCRIALAVIDDRPKPVPGGEGRVRRKLKEWRRRGLYKLYVKWDRRHFSVDKNAFAIMDARPLISEDIRLKVVPIEGKYTDRFKNEDIDAIRRADLDVLIRFGFRIIKGGILKCPRYGVWSYHHGDNREYRGGPALFWEVVERNPISGSILQVLNEDLDGGLVINRSWSATNFDSLLKNRNGNYWKSASFVIRSLRNLHSRGWDYVRNRESQDGVYRKGIYRAPGNLRMIPFLLRIVGSRIKSKTGKLLYREYNHWHIALYKPGCWTNEGGRGEPYGELKPPTDRFYADPFVHELNDRNYVLFEDYRYETKRGVISAAEIYADGRFGQPRVVLEQDYHMSYPFVFERGGEIFMTPETREANRIELYKAVEFPWKWRRVNVLVQDVAAVDPTIYQDDERLWMFCGIAEEGAAASDELHLFSAPDLLGPWTRHPDNPVVSDIRRARPAGGLFTYEGQLIRPSQDCSRGYGYAINLNRVDVLSDEAYREQAWRVVTPDREAGCLGTHTLNWNRHCEVRDAKFRLRRWRVFDRVPGLRGREG